MEGETEKGGCPAQAPPTLRVRIDGSAWRHLMAKKPIGEGAFLASHHPKRNRAFTSLNLALLE
jgi:hypothetical protein